MKPFAFKGLRLQAKILLLSLVPLVLAVFALTAWSAMERARATEQSLERQRQAMIQMRELGIRSAAEVARSSIQPLLNMDDQAEAQRRAKEMILGMKFDGDSYLFAYDYQGNKVANANNPSSNSWDLQDADGKYLVRDMVRIAREQGDGPYQYKWLHPGTGKVETKYAYLVSVPEWEWVIGTGVYITDIDADMAAIEATARAELRRSILVGVLAGAALLAVVGILAVGLVRRVARPIGDTARAMEDIARGRGDLTRRLTVSGNDEVGELARQFNAFVSRMQDALREVRDTTGSVNQAAGEIATGSEELATRTEQSAASLQETSASMEEITATVNHTADSAERASTMVEGAARVAGEGGRAMQEVETTMASIDEAAARIAEIIGLIDGIAFQTNILALNASVEAARAGEHGRGFAVVAEEVRNLAGRSGDAAAEIRGLIDTSVTRTRQGSELVRRAGATMKEIVDSVTPVSELIGDISTGAREQSRGIGQVNTAVAEMDVMTQQNAAMVQQTSSSAAEMRRHAERLDKLIQSFVL
ncbi:methyl-accepting chemotaxis protein [Alloalcanivorax gelatiniphagus]|uniref:HAMP domain-containing protein n=2 Tax=Alloalcanivorax gelatiniphagus TaxID=1194167 RepID=A0ABY2XQ59_9GAMM|nr:methyl-accepting chemotaxis protein [Alloalcanivorax gelatiniphagus]TMW14234.1 HAMP domain-containing protein [Alloalcanivorax gelatiniphagus]